MKLLCGVSMASLALASGVSGAETCRATEADKAAVVAVLRTFYAALATDDLAKFRSTAAPGFSAYDSAQAFDSVEALFDTVKKAHEQGVGLVWTVKNPRVTVYCTSAWLSYLNDGSVTLPGGSAPRPQQWLESAFLEKRQGVWKIVFFHSTPVPAPAPAPAPAPDESP